MAYVYSKKKIIYCKDTNEKVTGDNYLSSNHWKNMRKVIYDKYKGKCTKCHKSFSPNKMHVHHLTYKRIGNEKESDLILLCEKCHSLVHQLKRESRKKNQQKDIIKDNLHAFDIKIFEIYLLLRDTDLDYTTLSKKYYISISVIKQIAAKKGRYGKIIKEMEKGMQ